MRLRARQGEKKKGVAGICGIAISTFSPPGTVSTVACKYNLPVRIYLSYPPLCAAIFSVVRVYTSHYTVALTFSYEAGNQRKCERTHYYESRFIVVCSLTFPRCIFQLFLKSSVTFNDISCLLICIVIHRDIHSSI